MPRWGNKMDRLAAMEAFVVVVDTGSSEWMFAPEIADGTLKIVLQEWELPRIDLWAVFPAGRTATTKARTFTQFVQKVMRVPSGAASADKS